MNSLFSRDGHLKSMELTVGHAEKYLGLFCSLLASYTRKTAKLRDKADLLVRQLHDFSNTEDPELRTTLKNLAEDLAMVQDYRQAQVERLETRVVAPLKTYGEIVKTKRAELKRFNADRSRELKELQKLERIRQKNPADRQSIAEVNAQKATNNAQRSTRLLEETICHFQRQKLEDIKRIFGDFITVEMLFHAKALEVYTHTFQNLESMDVDKDMELYTGRIRVLDTMSAPMDTLLASSSSMGHQASPTLGASTLGGPTLGTSPARRPSPIHRQGLGTSLSFRPTPVPAQRVSCPSL
ncbi:CBY1-interacting BAR domain-containing protein 2-like [Aplochiton taeniatus]